MSVLALELVEHATNLKWHTIFEPLEDIKAAIWTQRGATYCPMLGNLAKLGSHRNRISEVFRNVANANAALQEAQGFLKWSTETY